MSNTAIIENVTGSVVPPTLPTAAWDLASFLTNAKSYLGVIGGLLIALIGLAIVIWAVVLIAKQFFGSNQQGGGGAWAKIVVMLIIGGAILGGGLVLVTNIATGGQRTIEELGGGFIVLGSASGLVH